MSKITIPVLATTIGVSLTAFTETDTTKQDANKPAKKPNIIFIMADDLGYGDIGAFNSKSKIETPALDQLAKDGIKLTQHYAGCTVCAPSRGSLMTGKHTGHCTIRGNNPKVDLLANPEDITIGTVLKSAGYTTAMFGKAGIADSFGTGMPSLKGFDYFNGFLSQKNAHYYYPETLWKIVNGKDVKYDVEGNEFRKSTKNPDIWKGRDANGLTISKNKKANTYVHDLFTEEALSFIDKQANAKEPFFLYIPYTVPHAEMIVPDDGTEKDYWSLKHYRKKFGPEKPHKGNGHYCSQPYPNATSAAMISRMDRDIGYIIDRLKKYNIDKNTLIIFTSDNGTHVEGGHNPEFFDSNYIFRGYKRDLFEGGIRTPFIAKWPKRITPGSESTTPSAFWDILPTFADIANVNLKDIAGIDLTKQIDGVTFLPTLLGKKQPALHNRILYWEFHEFGGRQAIRQGDWKLIYYNRHKSLDKLKTMLFNIKDDPSETNDLASKYPERVKNMTKIMNKQRTDSPVKGWNFKPL